MRFLVDQNLSPLLADELRRAGQDVVHTRDIDLRTAGDEVILQRALEEPLRRIAINAGKEGSVIVQAVKKMKSLLVNT